MLRKKAQKIETVIALPTSREVLEARQSELLALIAALDKEGVNDRGQIEVILANVNLEIAAL